MKKSTFFKQSILFIALGLTTLVTTAQTILTVDNNVGATAAYTTIQAAHDAAAAGDLIYVQPSPTFYGNVIIDKELTIVGRSHSEPIKVSRLGTVVIRSSNVTLNGLKTSTIRPQSTGAPIPPPFVGVRVNDCNPTSIQIGQGGSVANVLFDDIEVRGCVMGSTQIYHDSNDVLFSNNIFTSSSPLQIFNTSSTVIANNVFRFTSSLSLTNSNAVGTAILYNNMFINNRATTVGIVFNGNFNLNNNLTYNYGAGDITFNPNATSMFFDANTLVDTDPLFTNVDTTVSQSFAGISAYTAAFRLEDDLTLQVGSPALTGGGGMSEMGLYNNGYTYKILGNPKGTPTLDIINYDGAVPKNGSINVTINANAH